MQKKLNKLVVSAAQATLDAVAKYFDPLVSDGTLSDEAAIGCSVASLTLALKTAVAATLELGGVKEQEIRELIQRIPECVEQLVREAGSDVIEKTFGVMGAQNDGRSVQ